MDSNVSVVIQVGPYPANKKWLKECIESVVNQTVHSQIVIIDDMAKITNDDLGGIEPDVFFNTPWLIGVAGAFNFGVALAKTECVFMLGSDDTLDPDCLYECLIKHNVTRKSNCYYWVGVRYMDTVEKQFLPCHAAMVTKSLWRNCGGFAPECSVGAPDAALISTFMVNKSAGEIVCVNSKRTLYNYRRHNNSDTAGRHPWQKVIHQTRDILSKTWQKPQWNRM